MVDTVASVDVVARMFDLFSTLSPVWTGLKTNKTYGRAGGRDIARYLAHISLNVK